MGILTSLQKFVLVVGLFLQHTTSQTQNATTTCTGGNSTSVLNVDMYQLVSLVVVVALRTLAETLADIAEFYYRRIAHVLERTVMEIKNVN